jgi:hypothetical protein
MTTEQPATRAAERLAALLDLAREHDDEPNYIEIELLEAATRRSLALRETPPAQPVQPGRSRTRPA